MARKIDTDAVINNIRIAEQANKPATPASGYGRVYGKGNGLYLVDDAGNVGAGLLVTNVQSLTASGTFSAVVGNAYFFDISGLPGDVNFTLPSGEVGDRISVHITTGDDAYELIVKGAVNGSGAGAEWSRLFISGEGIELVLTTTTNWQVIYDGRIKCVGRLSLSGNDTTNSAATNTTPTWDTAEIDVGNICDLTNSRINIRRAGNYKFTGNYRPAASITDQKYAVTSVFQNLVQVGQSDVRQSSTAGSVVGVAAALPSKTVACAAGDYLLYQYQTQDANMGIAAHVQSFFQVEEV